MQALTFGLLALGWGLASWVYFDATERGWRYPVLWGLAVMAFGWSLVPVIIYLAVRNQGPRLEVAERIAVRQYLVTTAFTSMALTVAGAATALGTTFMWAVSDRLSGNDFRDLMASSLAATVIGAVLWVAHWRYLERQVASTVPDSEFRSLYSLRRSEVLTSTFLYGGVAALTSLWVLGGALSALFHASYAGAGGWLPALGPALVCAGAAAFHGTYYREVEASDERSRFDRIPAPERVRPPAPGPVAWAPPPAGPAWPPAAAPRPPFTPVAAPPLAAPPRISATPPPAPPITSAAPPPSTAAAPIAPVAAQRAGFCGHCGTPRQAGDMYCQGCGAQFGPPPSATAA